MRIDEPGADLAVALAIASAARRRAGARPATAAFGEIGLTGRLRAGDAGRAAARGVREARPRARVVAPAGTPAHGTLAVEPAETLRAGDHAPDSTTADRCRQETSRSTDATPPRARLHAHARPTTTRAATRSCSPRSQKIAPGTALRQAIDDVIRSHEGALIVIGDPHELSFLYSGGIRLDAPFRPQLLYELAKMDGAIIVDAAVKRLAWANVQLMPDPTIPSDETGTRHRTAERVAKQTGALVVSVSQQRETVTIFVGPAPLPARPGRRRAREDEPGARHARHVPAAARAGADAADRARVPERRRARRRARRRSSAPR